MQTLVSGVTASCGLSPSVTRSAAPWKPTVGWSSSSEMVPVPVAVARVAFTAPESASFTVSSGSSILSATTAAATVLAVSPAAKVSVPEVAAVVPWAMARVVVPDDRAV